MVYSSSTNKLLENHLQNLSSIKIAFSFNYPPTGASTVSISLATLAATTEWPAVEKYKNFVGQ